MLQGAGVVSGLLAELGVPATAISPLLGHALAVRRDAERLALVSKGDTEHILGRHTADSLLFALVRTPAADERWVDVGSGAGFPGLVLAICFPTTRFTLLEPAKRKAGFIEMASFELGLGNVRVEARRAERVGDYFDVGVSRALADPSEAIELIFPLLRAGGEAIVAGTGSVRGAREVRLDRPDVDSPGRLFMMTRGSKSD